MEDVNDRQNVMKMRKKTKPEIKKDVRKLIIPGRERE